MIGPMKHQRVRLERAGALVAGVQTLADYLRPGYITTDPYICARGHLTTRVHPTQYPAIEARRNAACRARVGRGRCGMPMWRFPIRAVFRAAARALAPDPGPGLHLIRQRTNGAPGQGGATHNDDDLGSQTP